MSVPSHSQEVVVTGGRTGMSARLDSLHAAADALGTAAGDLDAAQGMLFRAELDLSVLAVALSPATGIAVEAATAQFFLAAAGVGIRLHGTAAAVRTSVNAYEAAESFLARSFELVVGGGANMLGHAVRTLVLSPAGVLVIAGTAGAVWAAGHVSAAVWEGAREIGLVDAIDRSFGIDTEALAEHGVATVVEWASRTAAGGVQWAGEHPVLTGAVIEHALPGFAAGFMGHAPGTTFLPGVSVLLPTDSQTMTGLLLVGLGRFGMFGNQPLSPGPQRPLVDVRRVSGATPPARHAPAGVGELWRRQRARSTGLGNGHVRVEQIRSGDGKQRWIVYVPATTSGSTRPGSATTDMTSNVETASGRRSAQHETVTQAMRRAGIRKGEEVMMVGYSQGGLVAGSLIEDPEFREEVDVTSFFTVGSPISDFDIPEGVDTLSVEHAQDLVPDLDGNRNPDRATWATVTVDLDAQMHRQRMEEAGMDEAEIDQMMSRPLYAHGGELYTGTIDDLESGGEPALSRWRERNAGFFDGEIVETSDFAGRRP